MAEMELVGVRVEMPSSSPIALLREVGSTGRVLPIFIGAPEATAIAFALEEVVTPRPMTHDLLQNVLDELGVSLEKVTITELRDGVFIAELELHAHDGVHTVSVDLDPKGASTIHVEASRALSGDEVQAALAEEGDYSLLR